MIQLKLLGAFQVEAFGSSVVDFHTSKVRALLAFLTLENDRPHERELLATMLWPDESPEKALANLRQGLYRLGQAFDGVELPAPLLLTTRQSIQLNPQLAISVDALQLYEAVATARAHSHRRLSACRACIERLRRAVALYRGELLAGFNSGGGLPFDEWLLFRREQLRATCAWALAGLAEYHDQRREGEAARLVLSRWIELEPWNEEAHRRLIATLARDGQRAAALAQYERCRQALDRELDVQPSPETLELVSRIRAGRLAGWAVPPYSVPTPDTPLVGRDAELAAVGAHLASASGRLLTLTGSGGSGKTRLAIAAAQAARGSFADGIFFVHLAAVHTPPGMLSAIAETLGLIANSHDADHAAILWKHLRGRELLLILDNCEQLLDAAGLVSTMLAGAPALRMLVTSRAPLRIPAEELLVITGLEVYPPSGDQQLDAGEAPAAELSPAVRLFLQTTQRVDRTFAPGPEALHAMTEICRAVGGLPLAILLAAGLITRLTPGAILALLRQDLDVLISDQRGLPERHRSLRALFQGSWDLLGPAERQTLAHIALFAGPFSRDAAVAVVGGEYPVCATLPMCCGLVQGRCRHHPGACGTAIALETLAEHALLQRQGPGRYALHPLVRQFAAEDRAALPEAQREASRTRHRVFFLSLLGQLGDQIVGPGGQFAIEQLRCASDDIHLAWQDAITAGDHALIGGAIRGLLYLARVGGVHAASAADLGGAVERIRELDVAGAVNRIRGLDTTEEHAPRQLLAELLVVQAEVAYTWGDYRSLIAAATEATCLAQAQGRFALEAEARIAWGKGLWRIGDTASAREQIEQAAAIVQGKDASEVGQRLRSDLHYYQGVIDWGLGRFQQARAHYNTALAIARTAGYSYGEGDALNNLALVAIFQGAYREAIAHSTAALATYRAAGNRAGEGLGLLSIGLAHLYLWEDMAAQDAFDASRSIFTQIGDRQNESIAAISNAILLIRLGAYATARTALEQGISLCRELEHRRGLSIGLTYKGLLLHLTGNQAGAEASCREALHISEQAADPTLSAYAATHLGHALASSGRPDEAQACYERAAAIRQYAGQWHLAPDSLAGLAHLAIERGDLSEAIAHVEAILFTRNVTDLIGTEEPTRITLVCHRVLAAAGDPRAAIITMAGARQLAERLERLASPSLAQSLRAVPGNRELLLIASREEQQLPPASRQFQVGESSA